MDCEKINKNSILINIAIPVAMSPYSSQQHHIWAEVKEGGILVHQAKRHDRREDL